MDAAGCGREVLTLSPAGVEGVESVARPGVGATTAGELPPRTTGAGTPAEGSEPALLPAPDGVLSAWVPRPGCRAALPVVADGPAEGEESDVFDADEPEDPVRSANAIGIAATAEPTPSATASAPIRPTYRAELAAVKDSGTARAAS